jgi:hypothetical protein
VPAYPHCVGFERDHSTQSEWLDTKDNGETGVKFKMSGLVSATSQRVKAIHVISTAAQEMAIFLPWKKFVLPDPLAPTTKKMSKQILLMLLRKYKRGAGRMQNDILKQLQIKLEVINKRKNRQSIK